LRCISIVRSIYFKIFAASFLITFLSHETGSLLKHQCSFFIITGYEVRLILTDGSVGVHLFYSMIWLTCFCDFGTCPYHCFLSGFTHISLS
jgi:hypothetical protein